jgi:hypothetical protein
MQRFQSIIPFLLVFALLAMPAGTSAGSLDDAAKKADQGVGSAGQKVDDSTKGMRETTDSAGKQVKSSTKSGADKVGGFFDKTSKNVEGWMKNLEKKVEK